MKPFLENMTPEVPPGVAGADDQVNLTTGEAEMRGIEVETARESG